MEMLKLVGVLGVFALVVATVFGLRCKLGHHPAEGRLMRSGKRDGMRTIAKWECGRCHAVIGETDLEVDTTLMLNLRKQTSASRARSRVINLVVVDTKEKSA